jgi:hypothetical protein
MLGPLLAAALSPVSLGAPYRTAGLIAVAGVVLLTVAERSATPEI